MYRGNLLKFMYPVNDPKNMRAILLCSTINRELVFADKDPYWGIGEDVNKDPSTIPSPFKSGNNLGKILINIRNQLFTSSPSQIDEFLTNDANFSRAKQDTPFWKDIM